MDGGFRVLRLGKAKQVLTAAGRRDPLELACHTVAVLLLTPWSHGVPPGQFLILVGWDALG